MKKFINKYNVLLFLPLLLLMISSFFCMYQAKFVKDIYSMHLVKQILWFFIGFFILFILRKVKIRFFFHYSFYFYVFSLLLLFLVLFFGKEINGSKAWFSFKFFNFQPSEFMKISLLLYLSKLTDDFHYHKREFFYLFKCFIVTLLPSILVFLEPDTGAIIFYFLLLFSSYVLSGIRKRWFVLAFLIFSLVMGTFIYFYLFKQDLLIHYLGTSIFYRMDRLIHFKEGSGMQINNALITIGNSGLWGSFLQNSLLYVPEFPTDFVFTLLISLFGFVGGSLLIACLFTLCYYFIHLLTQTQDLSYKIFIHGFLYLFLFQQIYNIFMNLGLVPIMGIPLPFLSYGGSNMIVYFIFLGLILNIKKRTY